MAAAGFEDRQRLLDHEVRDVDIAQAGDERFHGGAHVGAGGGGDGEQRGQDDHRGNGPNHESVIRVAQARSQRKA